MKKNEVFKFKQFDIIHRVNAQKVSTDSVLLGAWADLIESKRILDIGTGCGVLALMSAQRNLNAEIIAIEIEKLFAEEARINFDHSQFSSRINLINLDVKNFSAGKFDHIICNPPYFSNSLKSNIHLRNNARHDLNLSFDSLAETVSKILDINGKISLVVPFIKQKDVIKSFATFELFPTRICKVSHNEESPSSLSLIEFQNSNRSLISESELVIKDGIEYNEKYRLLLRDFLTIF